MQQFVTTVSVASPLVVWPAVEFYLPAIPLSGVISVGSVLLFSLLGGLVGLNLTVVTAQWHAGRNAASTGSLLEALTTSGATACCCCAPAMYRVARSLGQQHSPSIGPLWIQRRQSEQR